MKRHIGKIANTDIRCVVVMMQIPGREDHALVVSIDNLPPRFEQALMDIVESAEGQSDEMLANVLTRRVMPDTGQNMLQTLHNNGLMMPVPVDNVVMLPQPNMPFPLRKILESLGKLSPNGDAITQVKEAVEPPTHKYNPHASNIAAASDEQKAAIGRNLLIEAELLEADAKRKRELAYSYNPELRRNANRATAKSAQDTAAAVAADAASSIRSVEIKAKATEKKPAAKKRVKA